jgi:hypothetical protein
MLRSDRDGLKSALKWREETFGNKYRTENGSTSDEAPENGSD